MHSRGNTFAEAVHASYLQHTRQRPRFILNYIQAAKRFEVVIKHQAVNMLLSSLPTGDTRAAKSFVFGMNWIQWATVSDYTHFLAKGACQSQTPGSPRAAPGDTTRGADHRGPRTSSRFPSPRPRTPTRTLPPTLSGPANMAASTSSSSTSAPSFEQQRATPGDHRQAPYRSRPRRLPPYHSRSQQQQQQPKHRSPPRASSPTARIIGGACGVQTTKQAPPSILSDEDTVMVKAPPNTAAGRKAPPPTPPNDDYDPWKNAGNDSNDPFIEILQSPWPDHHPLCPK